MYKKEKSADSTHDIVNFVMHTFETFGLKSMIYFSLIKTLKQNMSAVFTLIFG